MEAVEAGKKRLSDEECVALGIVACGYNKQVGACHEVGDVDNAGVDTWGKCLLQKHTPRGIEE